MQSLQEFGDIVRQRRLDRGLTLDALAKVTGISKPYLSNIENGTAPGPASAGKLEVLERALGLAAGVLVHAADWLRTPDSIRQLVGVNGLAPQRRADGTLDLDALLAARRLAGPGAGAQTAGAGRPQAPREFPGQIHLRAIPLINAVAAGPAAEFTDLDYPPGVAEGMVAAPAASGSETAGQAVAAASTEGLFAVRVFGDSMEPMYQAGDIVVLSPTETPRDGDDCLVRLDAAENFATTFKRIYFLTIPQTAHDMDAASGADQAADKHAAGAAAPQATHVRLEPLNPRHVTRTVALAQITGLYRAVWKISAIHNHHTDAATETGTPPGVATANHVAGEAADNSADDPGRFLEQD